jgi:hypothetical protein
MGNGLGLTAEKIRAIASDLVDHLRVELTDTSDRRGWTDKNIYALQSFNPEGFALECSPWSASDGSDARGEFLWDFTSNVKGTGLLIAVESEWRNEIDEIRRDFKKLLYVRSPIKLMICRVDEKKVFGACICDELFKCMKDECSEFVPGELFIIYCRKWSNDDGSNGDIVFQLQIEGEPVHRCITAETFAAL